MLLGYNTNGMAHHDLLDAVALLAEIGYRGVAITVDHGALAPGGASCQLQRLQRLFTQLGMRSVIETGARYLLDPRTKHEPTLVTADSAGRARRIEFYRHAIRCAAELRSDCVSLWSGLIRDSAPAEQVMRRLVDGLGQVLDYAAAQGVVVGFEPEPGMFIDSMQRFEMLLGELPERGSKLRLTLDVGHLQCQREFPLAQQIGRWGPWLSNVHIEDMRAGIHQHLMFGQGEIDFPPVLQALAETGYSGGVYVELSGHSREAPEAARRAFEFLNPLGNGL